MYSSNYVQTKAINEVIYIWTVFGLQVTSDWLSSITLVKHDYLTYL